MVVAIGRRPTFHLAAAVAANPRRAPCARVDPARPLSDELFPISTVPLLMSSGGGISMRKGRPGPSISALEAVGENGGRAGRQLLLALRQSGPIQVGHSESEDPGRHIIRVDRSDSTAPGRPFARRSGPSTLSRSFRDVQAESASHSRHASTLRAIETYHPARAAASCATWRAFGAHGILGWSGRAWLCAGLCDLEPAPKSCSNVPNQ
jgi:hypothetical protein